jgi:nucleotide-binding universal stress UspA family protein
MEFARLMVTVDLSPTAADRVRVASGLAKQWGTMLMGVAATEIKFPNFVPARPLDPRVLNALEARAKADLEEAKTLFFREVDETVRPTWRSQLASSIDFLIRESRSVDLLVVGRHGRGDGDRGQFDFSVGRLLMEAGRPLLLVPPNTSQLSTERILIAWKDTRETRRAVADALPLLKAAKGVWLATFGLNAETQGAEDISEYLSAHGIDASITVVSLPSYQRLDIRAGASGLIQINLRYRRAMRNAELWDHQSHARGCSL